MVDSNLTIILPKEVNWRQCDLALSYRLDEPLKGNIVGYEATMDTRDGFIPCAIHPDISNQNAAELLRQYVLEQNPELANRGLTVRVAYDDHIMTGNPKPEQILHIVQEGCAYPTQ